MTNLEDRFWTLSSGLGGSGTVRYVVNGYGPHCVLLLPGALDTLEDAFSCQLDRFDGEEYTLIAWDPPGYGRKGTVQKVWDVSMFTRDAEMAVEFVRHLGHDRFSIVGWSDGAITALLIAEKYPKVVRGVVAISGNVTVDPEDIKIYEERYLNPVNVAKWMDDAAQRNSTETYGSPENYVILLGKWTAVMKNFLDDKSGDICESTLKKVSSPTLVIHGRKDSAVPVHHAFSIFSHLTNADLHVIGDADHDPQITHAQQCNMLIDNFFRSKK